MGLVILAVVLMGGLMMPAAAYGDEMPTPPPHDDRPPLVPHTFTGMVRVDKQTELVTEGTLVEAFLNGLKKAETNVDAGGRYTIGVGGEAADEGKPVTFKVDGVLANETATWASGEVSLGFDLTVPGSGSFPLPLPFDCFIATAAYGTGEAEEIGILREFRDAALLPNKAGAAFVWLYYEVSPPLAEVIARHDFLRAVVRSGLIDPVVAVLHWSHSLWAEGER